MTRVVVIGAGVVGAAVARELALRGAEVVVVDRGEPAGGTSRTTFAMDITTRKTPREYFELSLLGAARHTELEAELSEGRPGAGWIHRVPSIEIGRTPRDRAVMAARRDRLAAWGQRVEEAPATGVGDVVRGFDLSALDGETAVVYPDAAWYEPAAFVSRMLSAARTEVRHGVRVTGLHREGTAWTVRGRAGADTLAWRAETVVNCAGADAARVAALAGTRLPLTEVPGAIGYSGPLDGVRLGAVLSLWDINFRPAGDGGLCLHSYPVDARLAPDAPNNGPVPSEAADELRRRAAEFVPPLAAAPTADLAVRTGVRPVPADGLPLVGTHPAAPGLYTVVTHSAVHLAPVLARLAADEIATGRRPGLLRPYAVDRPLGQAVDESLREMTHTYHNTAV